MSAASVSFDGSSGSNASEAVVDGGSRSPEFDHAADEGASGEGGDEWESFGWVWGVVFFVAHGEFASDVAPGKGEYSEGSFAGRVRCFVGQGEEAAVGSELDVVHFEDGEKLGVVKVEVFVDEFDQQEVFVVEVFVDGAFVCYAVVVVVV